MNTVYWDSVTYCRMSASFRNFSSAGAVGGASGSLRSKLGMPSRSAAAIAKSSRSLRLRDDAIELQVVNTDYRTSK
jgi:hypothetical protein